MIGIAIETANYIASDDCTIKFPEDQSEWEESSPERILEYLERDSASGDCYDMYGRRLTDSSLRNELIKHAKEAEDRRVGTLSVRWGSELSETDYQGGGGRFFTVFAERRPSLKVAYSVHRDTDPHHIHFALFGSEAACSTRIEDLERMHKLARKSFYDEGERAVESEMARRKRGRRFKRGIKFTYGD